MEEIAGVGAHCSAGIAQGSADVEPLAIAGRFKIECRDQFGKLKWVEEFDNAVVDTGKKYLLDAMTAAPTIAGPFLGLIGTYTATAAADTMASHAGWAEFTGVANRGTPTWTGASGTGTVTKAHSGSVNFTATAGGTINGCFIVLGSGAVNTISSTAGTLYSAGSFTGKTVAISDVLQVTYSTTLS